MDRTSVPVVVLSVPVVVVLAAVVLVRVVAVLALVAALVAAWCSMAPGNREAQHVRRPPECGPRPQWP